MATERIDVIVNDRGTRRVRRNIESIGTSADVAGTAVRTLQAGLLTLGVGLGLSQAVRTLADFSQELSTVRAITRSTGDEFDSLRERAELLGTNTRFSATQAAEGMTFLARAGFDANEILGSINGTLQLAQAGALDLASAADIASNVLTGFGLEVNQTGRVVDVLALAANRANTDVQQLGTAMQFVAPVAASFGVELEEATAAVQALSNAGLQGSLAGTGLRRVLSELESPSTATIRILRSLGLEASQVAVSQVGLTSALRTLSDAGLSAGQALEVFGDRGGPAFAVLSQAIPDIVRFNEELLTSDGTAQQIAATMDDNLNGALLAVNSAFEGLIIAVGRLGAEETIRGFLDGLAESIRNIAENLPLVVEGFTALATVIVVRLLPAVARLAAGLLALTLTNPFTAIAAAIAVGVTALVSFGDEIRVLNDQFTLIEVAAATFDVIGERISAAVDFTVEFANQAATSAREYIRSNQAISQAFDALLENGRAALNTLLQVFVGVGRGAVAAFDDLPNSIGGIAIRAANNLIAAFETGLNFIRDAFRALPGQLLSFFQELPGQIVAIFRRIRDAVQDFELPSFDDLFAPDPTGGDRITFGRIGISDEQRRASQSVINAFNSAFREDFIATLTDTGRAAFEQFESDVIQRAAINAAEATGNEAGEAAGQALADGTVNTAAEELNNAAQGPINEALQSIREQFLTINDVGVNAIQGLEDSLVGFVTTGRISFTGLVNSILADIARIAVQQNITGPLAGLLFGGDNIGGGGLLGGLGGLLGFAGGGSFTVGPQTAQGGFSGADNRLVAFRARDGERVSVSTPGQQEQTGDGGGPLIGSVNLNVTRGMTRQEVIQLAAEEIADTLDRETRLNGRFERDR